jgi:hypothetical protein
MSSEFLSKKPVFSNRQLLTDRLPYLHYHNNNIVKYSQEQNLVIVPGHGVKIPDKNLVSNKYFSPHLNLKFVEYSNEGSVTCYI